MTAPLPTRAPRPRRLLVVRPLVMRALDAVGAPYDLPLPVDWSDAAREVASGGPADVVLAEPVSADGAPDPRLRELTRRHPSATVVAVLPPDASAAAVETLLSWGVSEVVHPGEATPRALRARLLDAHARPFRRLLERTFSPWVAAEANALLLAAARVAVDGGGAEELAASAGIAARTLTVRCERAGLPPPRRLQAWTRLLLAATLLDEPGRTAAEAARAAGFGLDRSLRRAAQALVGEEVRTLRAEGAFASTARALLAELREMRGRAPLR